MLMKTSQKCVGISRDVVFNMLPGAFNRKRGPAIQASTNLDTSKEDIDIDSSQGSSIVLFLANYPLSVLVPWLGGLQ